MRWLRSNRNWQPTWWIGKRFYAWHLTFEDLPDVRATAAHYQRALARFGGLEFIESQWLHLTLHGLGLTTEVSPPELAQSITAVGERLADLPVQKASFDGWATAHEAISLITSNPLPFRAIRDAIRAGMLDSLGMLREPADGFLPHLSLAYVTEDQPTEPVTAALTSAEQPPVVFTVRKVSLIEMYREDAAYRWETVAELSVSANAARPERRA